MASFCGQDLRRRAGRGTAGAEPLERLDGRAERGRVDRADGSLVAGQAAVAGRGRR